MFCENCGEKVSKSWKKCPYCGEDICSIKEYPKRKKGRRKRRKKGYGKLVRNIAILSVVIVVGMSFFGKKPDNNGEKDTKEQGTEIKNIDKEDKMDTIDKADTKEDNLNTEEELEKSPLLSDVYREYYINAYSLETYDFKRENDKLEKEIKKYQNNDLFKVTEKGKIGWGTYWVRTNGDSDIYYAGSMKDNKPEGKGVLLKKILAINLGISADLQESYYAKIYEGNFEEGKMKGYGKKYVLPIDAMPLDGTETEVKPMAFYEEFADDVQSNIFLTANPLCYEGYFENNKYSGKGNKFEYPAYSDMQRETDMENDFIKILEGEWDGISEESYQDYILPDSDIKKLTEGHLVGLSESDIQMAINEIYARHGRMFNDENVQNYFNDREWYMGTISPEEFNDDCLNDVEINNIEMLEKSMERVSQEETTSESESSDDEQYYSKHINVCSSEFKKGKEEGKCKLYYQGKLIFDGEMKKGNMSGKGKLYYPNTTQIRYEGEWKNGNYHGKGTQYSENGEIEYSGKWNNGKYGE